MGCASSKQARLERRPRTMTARCYSLPDRSSIVAEGYHVVALKSSTIGSLKLDSHRLEQSPSCRVSEEPRQEHRKTTDGISDFFVDDLRAKQTWAKMMEEKRSRIPRTPTLTPPNEPESINAWELMEGLEDASPFRILRDVNMERAFSFHTLFDPASETDPVSKSASSPETGGGSPTVKRAARESNSIDSINIDFDPEVIATFRKALDEISPGQTPALRSPEIPLKNDFVFTSPEKSLRVPSPLTNAVCAGIVKARVSDFEKKLDAKKFTPQQPNKCPPDGEEKVVLYLTTLRGVRKTYEDCCGVRLILKGFGVLVDERDVSMHREFREELIELVGEGETTTLPRLFVKGRYLGGAEEVRQLHDAGEMEKYLQDCELDHGLGACEVCGDARFVNCDTCHGSCKLYQDRDGRFHKCPNCNENGIVRCPRCCCS